MKVGIFCIAHTIREGVGTLSEIEKIRLTLNERGVETPLPKLGLHVTVIPPFTTDEGAARLLAFCLSYVETAMLSSSLGGGLRFPAIGTGFDFYRNQQKNKDAFIVRLGMNDSIIRAVEQWRHRIPDIADWVYPPEKHDFNPHITIGEGVGIYAPIKQALDEGAIPAKSAIDTYLRLEVPCVMRKNEIRGYWEPVA